MYILNMRIGIFGCTADPFTEAHAAIVGEVLAQNIVDKVIIAPTIVDWHRKGKTSWLNDGQKCELISLMLQNDPTIKTLPLMKAGYWEIWDKDFRLREICGQSSLLKMKYIDNHRFIDTLVDIIQNEEWNYVGDKRNNEYFVIIGTDSYLNFKSWEMWKEIPKLAKLIVIKGRNRIELPPDDPDVPCIKLSINEKYADVSASKIREEWMSRGFDAYKKWIVEGCTTKHDQENEKLLSTPIFEVVRSPELPDCPGLKPIKINAPDWVSIMVEKDGKLLVEKQFRYGANDFIEEFPCGMVEKGEDPRDAVVRELEEETGIKLLDKTVLKLGQTNPNPAFMTNMMHYYYVNLDYAEYNNVDQKLDEHEKIELSWKDRDRFMFDLADDAHACGKKQVPAIALSMVKLYENSFNYPSCG